MHPLLEDYFDRLTQLHDEIKAALDGLAPEALDWVPGEGMNSLAVLVTHTAGSERFWIAQMAGGQDVERVRSEEFEAQDLTVEKLVERLDASLAENRHTLEALTVDDLARILPHPDGREFRVGWSLLHALDHVAQHTGHIQLTRQLWDQRG